MISMPPFSHQGDRRDRLRKILAQRDAENAEMPSVGQIMLQVWEGPGGYLRENQRGKGCIDILRYGGGSSGNFSEKKYRPERGPWEGGIVRQTLLLV